MRNVCACRRSPRVWCRSGVLVRRQPNDDATIVVSNSDNSNTNSTVTNVSSFVTDFGGNAGAALGLRCGAVTVAETGVLPETGGALEAAELDQLQPLRWLAGRSRSRTTIGQEPSWLQKPRWPTSTSRLLPGFFLFGGSATTNTIAADFIMSRATTTCSANVRRRAARAKLMVVINGQPLS